MADNKQPQQPQRAALKALVNIDHDGTTYKAGDELPALTKAQIAALRAAGAVAPEPVQSASDAQS